MMTVGSWVNHTANARLLQGACTVPVLGQEKRAVIVLQSHCDCSMTVQPSYHVSMFESTCVSVSCCILFCTFEVPSQSKMSGCTCLLHDCLKIQEDDTATVGSPRSLRMEAAQVLCDICTISMQGCRDCPMTIQSPYNLCTVSLRLCNG